MNPRTIVKTAVAVGVAKIMLLCSLSHARVEVIVHPQLDAESVSAKQIQSIYLMRTKVWPDGSLVKVYRLPDSHPSHKTFVQHHLRLQPYQLNRIWNRLIFSGTGSAPQVVNSVEEMKRLVQTTKGAIGYIDPKRLQGDEHGS